MKWRGPFSLGAGEAGREGGWTRGSDWRGGREALVCINSRMRSFVLERFPVQGRAKMPGVFLSPPIEVLLVPKLFFQGRVLSPHRSLSPADPRGAGCGCTVPGSVRSPPGLGEQLSERFVSQVSAICAGRLVCRTKGFGGDEGLWL